MYKPSILRAPDWVHTGEWLASGTIRMMSACVVDASATETTSGEAVTYVEPIKYLAQIAAVADATGTGPFYLAYKYPTEDDYLERNGLSAHYITSGEGVVGLLMIPGLKIQDCASSDYTTGGLDADGTWSTATYGDSLYFTDAGLISTVVNGTARGIFVEMVGDWVTYETI
jgi:hypothetical protein